ncbi:histidine kinase [Kutzneria sp. NPDC051319]|uniref:sensor histidine kinase n=1 Tax=Kutzneria sp. NPDC051319 TaxID=3155047 RepID=UPI00343F5131
MGLGELTAILPAAVAVVGLVAGWRRPVRAAWIAGPATIVVTIGAVLAERPSSPLTGPCWMVEVAALTVLVLLVVRSAPIRHAVPPVLAVACSLLRFIEPETVLDAVGMCVGIAVVPAVGAGVGLYLRSLARKEQESVRAQRLTLARDLHDFVAHDVSAILAQAQAAHYLAEDGPARDALGRIEQAGLHAMAAIDRSVVALRDLAEDVRAEAPGIEALPAVVDRFAASGSATATLDLDPSATLSGEAATTAYRVVVEALTNIRRHAPAATLVRVAVARKADRVEIRVTNDQAVAAPGLTNLGRRHGGHGLAGLRERVEAVGGRLSAGPADDGWQVLTVIPAATP